MTQRTPAPAISVVMPVYNSAPYLEEAVESILGQTFKDFEFIIVNDGSTDGSGEILDRYAQTNSRIQVIHQENQGIVGALNAGLRKSTGKYIARMDSDDISLPNRLAEQYKFMEQRPRVGISGTGCRHFGNASCVTWTMTDSEEIKSRLLFWPCMVHPTVIMRRELVVNHDLFYDPSFKQAEDHELWVRFARHCEMSNATPILLRWRNHDTQLTTACEEEIVPWSGLVHREALGDIGIVPTDAELKIHLSLHKGRFKVSKQYVRDVEEWLCKILDANDRNRVRNPRTFSRVLFERWFAVCAWNWELGGWIRKRFISSRLYKRGGSVLLCLRFYVRVPAAKMMERSSLGRHLKQDLRNIAFRIQAGEWRS